MKENVHYCSPVVESIEIVVELGFAGSTQSEITIPGFEEEDWE